MTADPQRTRWKLRETCRSRISEAAREVTSAGVPPLNSQLSSVESTAARYTVKKRFKIEVEIKVRVDRMLMRNIFRSEIFHRARFGDSEPRSLRLTGSHPALPVSFCAGEEDSKDLGNTVAALVARPAGGVRLSVISSPVHEFLLAHRPSGGIRPASFCFGCRFAFVTCFVGTQEYTTLKNWRKRVY